MSDKKKEHKYDGETYEKIIKSSMHEGSMAHFASKLIENFNDDQKEDTLNKIKGFSSVVDRLKYLLELSEEEDSNGGQDE